MQLIKDENYLLNRKYLNYCNYISVYVCMHAQHVCVCLNQYIGEACSGLLFTAMPC
jgi:hypothetical protein